MPLLSDRDALTIDKLQSLLVESQLSVTAMRVIALALALVVTATEAAFSATPNARLLQFRTAGSSAPVLTSSAVLPGYDFHWILDTSNSKSEFQS